MQQTIHRFGRVVGVAATAITGVALTGLFGQMYLWRAAFLYSQIHLWWQPAVIAGTAVLEFVVLGRATLRAATRTREMDGLISVILVELVFNMIFTVAFVGVPLL
jgi:hypothetical protein